MWDTKPLIATLASVLAGGAAGQFSVTNVERDVYLFASVFELGGDADTQSDFTTDNSLNFQGTVDVDVTSGFTSIQAMISQESSLVGGTLSASSGAGIGWNASSGSSGGTDSMSFFRVDFRVDAPISFELVADASGSVPLGFLSSIELFGTPDGGSQTFFGGFFGDSGSASGVLEPGDYSIVADSSSNSLDYFDTFNPGPAPFTEFDVWSFELTLVPAPASGAMLVAGGLFASRRRR